MPRWKVLALTIEKLPQKNVLLVKFDSKLGLCDERGSLGWSRKAPSRFSSGKPLVYGLRFAFAQPCGLTHTLIHRVSCFRPEGDPSINIAIITMALQAGQQQSLLFLPVSEQRSGSHHMMNSPILGEASESSDKDSHLRSSDNLHLGQARICS